MLLIIAAVLIVLWLLGAFAFHFVVFLAYVFLVLAIIAAGIYVVEALMGRPHYSIGRRGRRRL